MASYVVPQVEIHQLFSEIPIALTQNQVPFIFGPNYLLHRYGAPEEKSGTYIGEYTVDMSDGLDQFYWALKEIRDARDGEDTASSDPDELPYDYEYPSPLDPSKIEDSYTKLFADNAEVVLFTGDECSADPYNDPKTAERVADMLVLEVPSVIAKEVSMGRRLRMYNNGHEADVGIVAVLKAENFYPDDSSASTSVSSDSSSDYQKTRIVLKIDEELSATDFAAFERVYICEMQHGVEITRENLFDPNKTAMNWYTVADEETEQYGIWVNKYGFGVEINDPDIRLWLALHNKPMCAPVIAADLYLEYRELIDSASDTIHSLRNASEVVDALGAVSPDNPLAQAVYNAALNAGGQMIRYMAVPTDNLEGYSKVLNAATLTKEVYFLVPVTRDDAILDLVQSHVNAMSAPTVKRWRIAFVSAIIPDTDPIYTSEADTSNREFMAKVTGYDEDKKIAEVQFVVKSGDDWLPNPDTRFKKDLRVRDIFVTKFNHEEWGKKVPQEYAITKIVNNWTVRVSDPNKELLENYTTGVPEKAEIYHPYTNAQKAEVIRNLSSKFADRRMYNVFPSVFVGGGATQTGEFAAACVAGLVSACLPQQPITNLELVGIDDIPLTYQTFSYDDLNTMASGGTFIVMQDLPNDQVYIRHQISTAYEDNNLNTSELSITKNLDSISFYFDNLTSPYIGKYNITPELLEVLHNVITSGLTYLENTAWGLYGPQVIAEGTEILLLEQDALLKDHVNCNLKLNLPYPFNHLVLKLFV